MPRIPGTFSNGDSQSGIPPDLVWDEDNHPVIYACSMHIEHRPPCDGSCEPTELDSELQVEVLNEGRRYARLGMSFMGVPAAYQGHIPIPGIQIELVDLLMWLNAMKKLLIQHFQIDEFELEEAYRAEKVEFLRSIREANENSIKKARAAAQMAVAKKSLLGPDGNPIQH